MSWWCTGTVVAVKAGITQWSALIIAATLVVAAAAWAWCSCGSCHDSSASVGRVVVIAGGGTGVCLQVAKLLTQDGWIVFSGEFDERLKGKQCAPPHEIAQCNNPHTHFLDVRSDESIALFRKFVEHTLLKLGQPPGLHVLINNATVGNHCPLEYISRKTLLSTFNVQVAGALRLTQEFLPALRETSNREALWCARILNMSSGAAIVPTPIYGL